MDGGNSMRLRFTIIVLALTAVLGVGCGSTGSSGSSSGADSGSSASESSNASTNGDSSTGGDSSTSGDSSSGAEAADSGKPLTKAEFIKRGDAICEAVPQEYSKKLSALEEEAKKSKKPKPSKTESNLNAAVPPLYAAIEALEELAPPQGDEQEAAAIVAALKSAAKGLEEKPESELLGPKSPFAEFQKLTKAYGFKLCSQL
jgi:hypothetical protein